MAKHLDELFEDVADLQKAAANLAKLVSSQQEAIQQSEWDTLEAILRQKQSFVDQLAKFKNLKQTYLHAVAGNACETSKQLESAIKQLEASMERIFQEEQSSITIMQDRHLEMGRELRGMTQNRQAANCYSQPNPSPINRRIDIST
jgi:hypothetical protein